MTTERPRFLRSELVAEQAKTAFAEHAARIRELLPTADVQHVGGTSVAGLLTTGDVDVHVRVAPADLPAARDALGRLYEPLHPDRWRESAYFFAPDTSPRVEIALTAIGNLDDLHHGEAWRRMAADPELIAKYNALKRACEAGSTDDYDVAKREFFYENFRL